MSEDSYGSSAEYSDNDSFSDEGSYCSNEASDLITSESNMPELFTVRTDQCTGSYDRIELLVRQAKTLDTLDISEENKELLFSKIIVRSEAESIETEPWITSIFSLMQYPEASSMLHKKVNVAVRKIEGHETLDILISARFANVPEEIIYDMYEVLPGTFIKANDCRILLLSLERPVSPEEEKSIKRVFSNFKFATSAKLFPVHTEEVFLTLNGNTPAFTCTVSDQSVIKGFVLNREGLVAFINSMKAYYT